METKIILIILCEIRYSVINRMMIKIFARYWSHTADGVIVVCDVRINKRIKQLIKVK